MKYEEYKDSGMSWIGQVPTQWKRSRLKFLFSHSNSGVWGEEEKGDENDIACFRVADFDYQKGYLGFDKLTMRNITAKELEGRLLSQGSLLIEKSGGGDATPVGRVVRFNYEDKATCSNFVHFVTVDESHNSDFLYYYFYAMYANKENLLYFNQTTGIQNLKVGEYLGQSIFIPTFEEQEAIASYLDEKCGKINGAIDVQKKKINLLNELKQTIITNAVTKGLNSDAPMKNSGVQWIGEIPEDWELKKIKFLTSCNDDTLTENTEDNTIIKYVEIADVSNVEGVKKYTEYTFKEAPSRARRITKVNDVVISTVRTYLKAVAKIHDEDLIVSTGFAVLRPKQIDESFLEYATLSEKFLGEIESKSVGVSYPAINSVELSNIKIPVPSMKEQIEIAKHINNEVSKIDSQISKANRRIELLNELKQSVITEAVTGKIKVI